MNKFGDRKSSLPQVNSVSKIRITAESTANDKFMPIQPLSYAQRQYSINTRNIPKDRIKLAASDLMPYSSKVNSKSRKLTSKKHIFEKDKYLFLRKPPKKHYQVVNLV